MARTMLKLTATAAMLLGGAFAAQAADYIPEPPVVHVPEKPKGHGGWYLRGDIGVSVMQQNSDVTYRFNGGANDLTLDKARFKTTGTIGGGVGYKLNKMFRADLTLNHRFGGEFEGSQQSTGSCAGGAGSCLTMSEQDFSSTELMANAYVDFKKIGHVTPYIGGGLGVARTSFGQYNTMYNCFSATAGACPGAAATATNHTYTQTRNGNDAWNFAWNLQAGASVDLSHNTVLDFGYKYTRIHDVQMTNDTILDTQYNTKSLGFHDVRAGIRYHF